MLRTLLLVALSLAVAAAAALAAGAQRWHAETRRLHDGLAAARAPHPVTTFDSTELAGLPAPVQRFFRAALTPGQPIVTGLTIDHLGTFNMAPDGEQWRPFTSTQRVVTRRPGFDWEARIAMMPGLRVRVHDAYVAGEGVLHASLFGLVSLAELRGTREVAEGELMRFFAEAAWYPTALLPSQGVRWEAVDDSTARATLRDGDLSLTLRFRFGADGLVTGVRSEARGRTVGDSVVPTPWEGRWRAYEVRDGMRVPTEGEVAWILPEGERPYWRGRITGLSYEFAR